MEIIKYDLEKVVNMQEEHRSSPGLVVLTLISLVLVAVLCILILIATANLIGGGLT